MCEIYEKLTCESLDKYITTYNVKKHFIINKSKLDLHPIKSNNIKRKNIEMLSRY